MFEEEGQDFRSDNVEQRNGLIRCISAWPVERQNIKINVYHTNVWVD